MSGTWITETSVVYARALWDEGLATSEIARRIRDGCTKSAIVGYAHRNGFPPRPSPIIRGGQRAEAAPRVPKKLHRKPLEPQQKASLARKAPKPAPAVAALKVACRPDVLAVPSPPHRQCQWPFGEPRTRGFRFCEATPVLEGKPYCRAHSEIAYHRAPRWHAEAPA